MLNKLKIIYSRVNAWCVRNPLGFGIIVLAITFAPAILKKINWNWQAIANVLLYSVTLPIYALLIAIVTIIIVINLIRRKFIKRGYSKFDLVGTWKNEWGDGGPAVSGSEYVEITRDMHYYVKKNYRFNIIDFRYDKDANQVRFTKVDIRPNDGRRRLNVLTVENNYLLVGTEELIGEKGPYSIKYTKLS